MFSSCQKYSPHKWQYLPLMLAYICNVVITSITLAFAPKFFVFLKHFSHKWGNISKNSWSLLKRLQILDGLHFLPWLGPYLSKVMMSQWVLLRHYNVPILAPFSINIWIRMNFSRVNWNRHWTLFLMQWKEEVFSKFTWQKGHCIKTLIISSRIEKTFQ